MINSIISSGHQRNLRSEDPTKMGANRVVAERARLLDEINRSYKAHVRPIFEKKCFDCHSGFTRYPWYYKICFIRSWIDDDIKEALEHMDFSTFPFKGHGSPEKDPRALEEVLKKESMPPLRYRIMHGATGITADEKTTIQRWIDESFRKLSRVPE